LCAVSAGCRQAWPGKSSTPSASITASESSKASESSAPSRRWTLVHLIEETARHAGHADILREQLDGRTGR